MKEAYFRMAKRFHPDAHHEPALSDLRDKLEAVFIRLGDAYEVLRNPRIRASYEKALDARSAAARRRRRAPRAARRRAGGAATPPRRSSMAEEAIRKAARSVAAEKYWEAIQLLEPAIGRVEGKVRQNGRVLLARAYMKNPNWVKQGEELLLAVMQDDPKNIEAYMLLGEPLQGGRPAQPGHQHVPQGAGPQARTTRRPLAQLDRARARGAGAGAGGRLHQEDLRPELRCARPRPPARNVNTPAGDCGPAMSERRPGGLGVRVRRGRLHRTAAASRNTSR